MRTVADAPARQDTTDIAMQVGFAQCVAALRRALYTTPAGWALVAWMCWGAVPPLMLGLWVGGFAMVWAASLGLVIAIDRRGAMKSRDAPVLMAVAALDGMAWGSAMGLLVGFAPALDPWLCAVLCGVTAVNAPVYMSFIRAYRVQVGALWVASLVGAALSPAPHPVSPFFLGGLTLFLGLIVYYMNPIAQRVVEGIRLQLANAQLTLELREALALVERDAATDALTGQPNRRALDVLLAQQIEAANGNAGLPLSVLLLDIDHFKRINDVHGHGIGDDALRAFARRVQSQLREGDVCARYGGEEFVVVLPDTPLPVALQVAERLRSAMAETPLLKAPLLPVTVSIGAAQFEAGQSAAALLDLADQAAYAAKRAGRNQVRPLLAEVPPGTALSPSVPAQRALARRRG